MIVSSGIQGDHIVPQAIGRITSVIQPHPGREWEHPDWHPVSELFEEAERQPDGCNLVLSCSECNGGSRNKKRRMLPSYYRRDRDAQEIVERKSGPKKHC